MRKVIEKQVVGLDGKKTISKVTLEGCSEVYDFYDKKTDKLICFRNVLPSGIVYYLHSLVTGELIVESRRGLTIISDNYYCSTYSEKNVLGYVTHEVRNNNQNFCADGVTVFKDVNLVEYIYKNLYGESMVIDENLAILNGGNGKIIVIDTKKNTRVDYNFNEMYSVREKLNISNKYRDSKMLYVTYGVYFNFFDLVNKTFKYDKFISSGDIDLKTFNIYNRRIYYITSDGKLLDEELKVLLEGYSNIKFHDYLPYVFLQSGNKHGLADFTSGKVVLDVTYDEVVEVNGEFLALKKSIDKRYTPN